MTQPIVLVANTAGGVGRTTLAHSIVTAAAEYGKRVLVIDGDPQATLTFRCGIENPRLTSAEVFSGKSQLTNALVKTVERFSLLPSASRLANSELTGLESLVNLEKDFDLLLIDTPSGPSRITAGLIAIATHVVIPVNSSFHSLRGALHTRDFQKALNPSLTISLVISNSDEPLLDETVTTEFKVLEPIISRSSEIKAAEVTTQSILTFASHSQVSSEIRELTYALLEKLGQF